MRQFNEHDLTDAVIAQLAGCDDPRFKIVMTSLIRHLHDFVREVALSEAEWMAAIRFLTAVGQKSDDKRQEFILLSDTLGASILVDAINHRQPTGAVESTVLGPFYWEGAPERPLGSDITNGAKGEAAFYSGRLLTLEGRSDRRRDPRRLVGRRRGYLRHADARSRRDAMPRQVPHRRRGALLVPLNPTGLLPDPDGRAGRRHDAQDAPPPEPPGPYPHDRFRARLPDGRNAPVRQGCALSRTRTRCSR